MNKIYTLWIWALLLPLFSFSQTVEVNGELKQWHKVSLSFQGPFSSEQDAINPFTDYRLSVTFSKDNHSITVPGYYAADGQAAETGADTGAVWRVHFVPTEVGIWTYEVSFRTGPNIAISEDPLAGVDTAFSGVTGSIDILPSDKSGEDLRGKGMLNYVGEHYLQFSGNREYYIKSGANSPENLLGYFEFDNTEDFGGVATPGLIDGLHRFAGHVIDWNEGDPVWHGSKGKGIIGALNYLASQSVNSIYFLTYNTDAGDGQDTYMWVSPDDKLKYDCSKLDQWEIVFEHADKLGLQLHIITQETENNTAMNSLSVERKLYYRELIARFGHHLAIQWNIGEENTNTDEDRILFANYIRQHDPYNHPIAIHSVYDEASTYYDGLLGEPSYEATSIQGIGTRYNEWSQELRTRSAAAGRKWIIYGDEQAPEVKPDLSNLKKLRRIYWETLLGGGGGCEWYFGYQDTFGDVQSEDFRIVETLWQQTAFSRRFWQAYVPFYEMEPNDNLAQGDAKVMHKDAGLFVVYFPFGPNNSQLDISGSTGPLSVFWFNPRTGGDLQVGSVEEVSGDGWVSIGTPPSETGEDWVALVGSGNRAPSFVMNPDQLNLNMNFEGTVSASADSDPVSENELTQTVVYHISPDSIPFATMSFDTSTGNVSFTALLNGEGEQLFTITANDGQEFNNIYEQTFMLRISPPTPPSASFSASLISGYAPLNIQFDAGESFDANGSIISYEWNFDGISTDTGEVVTHIFENIGNYDVQLIITDEDGMKDTAYQAILVEEMPNEMLFVTSQLDLNEGDLLVKNRLEQSGYTVIVKDQQSAVASDAIDKALVLISSSVSSSAVNTKFTNVSAPVMTWESYLFDDMGMTPGGNGTGFGSEYGDNNIAITDDTQFLAAGLSGNQLLLSSGSGLNWGNPSNEALSIGTVPGNPTKSLIFAYEEGVNMASGTAPARRVGFFIRDNTATGLTAEAWQLFDAAVCWAISCPASVPVNQPPQISPIINQSNEQGETVSLQINANDPEGDQITFMASGLPDGLSLDNATGLISGTLSADIGTYEITVTATDDGEPNESASISFSWQVIEPVPNQAPVITAVSNQSNEQGTQASLPISATDPEGDNITYGASGLPLGLAINPNTGLISGTITAETNVYTVTATATDDGIPTESASITFDWTVTLPPPNQAPSITPIADQSHAQQSTISLQVVASDLDGDNLVYEATNLPTGLSINSQTGLIAGTINANAANYSVQITVTDDGTPALSDQITFNWEVFVPVAPLETIWLEAECASFGEDWTAANDGLAAAGSFLNAQAGFVNDGNITAANLISLEIQADQAGTYAVWMRIKTSGGFNSLWQQNGNGWTKLDFGNFSNWTWVQVESVDLEVGVNTVQFGKREGALIDKWVVSIENGFNPTGVGESAQNCNDSGNNPPIITPIANQTNDPDAEVSLQVIANDPDGDQLTYEASGLPTGLGINMTTGLVSGTISATAGAFPVSITVSDDGDPVESSSITFDWIISGGDSDLPNGAWSQLGAEPDDRLENGYVKVGDKFLLLGGISDNSAHWYNPATNSWTQDVVSLPLEFHHFQPVVIDEIVYIVSAWSGGNNNAPAITHVYMYDATASANERWIQGPEIPEMRRRGGAGVAVYEGKIYVAGGINGGHGSGASSKDWFDVFDPLTGNWEILPDMPRVRDHYHGAVIGDAFYAAGGRNTGTANYINATYTEIDVFDFPTQTWRTLNTELPEGRGGTMTAVLGDLLMVIGGETGQAEAHTNVDVINTLTMTLEEVEQLPEGRHGAQAVVSDSSIFIAGGANINGFGTETLDQLKYDYGNIPNQELEVVQKSSILANPNSINFGDIEHGVNTSKSTSLSISGGNQGVVIDNIWLSGNNAFGLNLNAQFPIVLNKGQQLQVEVSFNAQSEGAKTAQINISNRGNGGNISIPVVANVLPSQNFAPVLTSINNQENTQGDDVFLQLSASDPNVNDVLTYQATNLPSGLTINPSTGLISGNISATVETFTVQVTVTDNGNPQLSDSQSFDWTVTLPPPNQSPSITLIANQSDAQQSAISLQIVAFDPDGDDLTYEAINLPTGLAINSQTGLISGIISANPATYSVEITVTDDGNPNLSDVINFDWEVFISTEPLTTIWLEAECATYGDDWNIVNDGMASEDEFLSTSGGFVNDGNINTNHIITLEIQAEEAGSYACWMRIKTSGGFNSLWQQNGNDWAKLDFANYGSWTWVQVNDVNLTVGLNEVQFAKREGAFIDKWVVSSENGFSPNGFGELAQNCGPQPNLAPQLSAVGDQTNEEGESVSLAIIATDPNGDNLIFQASGLPAGLSMNTNTGVISGQLAATIGDYIVNVHVEDDGEPVLSDSESFTWTITAPLPNQSPICTPLADQSHGQGAIISLFAEATDPDNDALLYEAVGLPSGLTINAQTGEISGTINDELGTYPVVITISDNGEPIESCSILLDWEVTEVVVNAEILFVVQSSDLSAGDAAIKDRLEATGYVVTVEDQGQAESTSADGKGAVLISSTVSSGAINTKFTDVDVPVMTWESYLFDDLKMTEGTFWVGFGNTNGATDITIQDDAHPLAAGLSGTVSMSSNASGLAWGAPNNTAFQIANVSGNTGQYAIFAYETGVEMVGMTAPARRVGFGMRDETASQMTVEGWALFDAAVCWMTGCAGQARFANVNDELKDLKAYPNPFLDKLTLEFPEAIEGILEIQIVDMMGRTHYQTKSEHLNGSYRFKLNTDDLAEGVYIISIKSGNQIWRQKLSKK